MKVLWLTNIVLPMFEEQLGTRAPVFGGWLSQVAQQIDLDERIEFSVCFPMAGLAEMKTGVADRTRYFAFPTKVQAPHVYQPETESHLSHILEQVQPDVVHIWGSEFPHTLSMTRAVSDPEKLVISIQGLCSYYHQHYLAGLPQSIASRFTVRDFLRQDNIRQQRDRLEIRGRYEREALMKARHVIGRTDWDMACAMQTNPSLRYHFCNETLRSPFYQHQWDAGNCERHSLFASQASNPIKGFHNILGVMPEIRRQFPDAQVYTTGPSVFDIPWYRISSYQKHLAERILKLGLKDCVHFLGTLDAEAMCQRLLKSHAFISASSIENSPNSVGEAMLLGVPTVSSDVGGVKNMLTHDVDGFVYQGDAPYMISHYVSKIFADDALARELSRNARGHAARTHDAAVNYDRLLQIYHTIAKQEAFVG